MTTKGPEFSVSRVFDAPRDLVWRERLMLTVYGTPINATEEERETFDAGRGSMKQGFTGTLDRLAAYLAKA